MNEFSPLIIQNRDGDVACLTFVFPEEYTLVSRVHAEDVHIKHHDGCEKNCPWCIDQRRDIGGESG